MPSLLSRLLPREDNFFEMFIALADNVHRAAEVLVEMFQTYDDPEKSAERIMDLEHVGDKLTRALFTRLNKSFITPFDREDIQSLSSRIDDVLDLIDAASSVMITYKIPRVRPGVAELTQVLSAATHQVALVIRALGKRDGVLEKCIEINRLEHESDRLSRLLIAQLFDEEKDPIQIIKWKEIIEVIEAAVDKCEDVANVIETVTLKNA
jgi:uncharacterized protein